MNDEFDELVRDSMTSFTSGIEIPAGLAASARRRYRQRRHAKLGLLAGGTAVACATAVIIVTTAAGQVAPTRPSIGPIKAQTTAEIVSNVDRALARTEITRPVEYVSATSLGPLFPTAKPFPPYSYILAHITRTWARGRVLREQFISRSGRLLLGLRTVTGRKASTETWISYPQRIWWQYPTTGARPAGRPGCYVDYGLIFSVARLSPAQWASQVRRLISCGTVTDQGRQRVDGVNAIRLKLHTKLVRVCTAISMLRPHRGWRDVRRTKLKITHCGIEPAGLNGLLWVNASTFLPVRMTPLVHPTYEQLDFRWLAPTRANLAMLLQPIPPGFKHQSLPPGPH